MDDLLQRIVWTSINSGIDTLFKMMIPTVQAHLTERLGKLSSKQLTVPFRGSEGELREIVFSENRMREWMPDLDHTIESEVRQATSPMLAHITNCCLKEMVKGLPHSFEEFGFATNPDQVDLMKETKPEDRMRELTERLYTLELKNKQLRDRISRETFEDSLMESQGVPEFKDMSGLSQYEVYTVSSVAI